MLCWGQINIPGEKRFGVLLPNLHNTKGVNYHCLHPARRNRPSRHALALPCTTGSVLMLPLRQKEG